MPSSKKRPNEGSLGSSTSPPLKRRKLSPTLVAIIFSSSKWVNAVPVEVWRDKVCKQFLTLKELSILRRTHTSFLDFWRHAMKQNVIRVPQGCPTVEKAMALAVVFSERKQYTATEPLKIVLDKGIQQKFVRRNQKYWNRWLGDDGGGASLMWWTCNEFGDCRLFWR